jgi:hypothetical protein
MSRLVQCPKCNEQGSLQPKKTKHGIYWRVAHYIGLNGETRKIKWCYIGKELPEEITSQLITHDYPKITQEVTKELFSYQAPFTKKDHFRLILPVLLVDIRQRYRLIRIC